MILYATKETFERYKLKLPQDMRFPNSMIAQAVLDKESGDPLLEWGAKLLYFDRRKCIQVTNFASRFSLFLVDVKMEDLHDVGNYIAYFLMDIYAGDTEMEQCLEKMFIASPGVVFSRLKDRSVIATLNHTQRVFADDGYRFYNYFEGNILKTREINRSLNREWLFTRTVDGKKEYFCSADRFRELVISRFGRRPDGAGSGR